ncbi:MAG TPA: 30S ribosomal protein S9 [Planctomycetota bacterium]|nr:30S ribosomal protein S9 [Planctomycetota bacterium]OQC22247.1 MAG: 30S ribosomal protein S9 [Planctomycetes bacterium ADurb.Bin069]HNS00606.1 30S ribosomal protein S9 [Planctomycetota bacterium]HNU25918.1 30S ribosomal protein S9 [Planctomycetota bacterium]HOE29302.1 30S ribosomal protein S9 [Planctomycetota bacterium]
MASLYLGTGRRKHAVARVRMSDGSGRMFINDREAAEYFRLAKYLEFARAPLVSTKSEKSFDITINVDGGGLHGQAGAVRLGIARALARISPENEKLLRDGKFLTRDARARERKKYGRRGARRGFQFSKR